ncbi:MAG: hypothetical protein SGJ03_05355 [Alphaproteobacteria bacterium]|nr:hypothetical protein [Alphaproteobacteria bacterium]
MPNTSSVTSFNMLPPALLRTIHDAYDDAVEAVAARQGNDHWVMKDWILKTIARHIVEQAKHGECDVVRLRASALTAVHFDS